MANLTDSSLLLTGPLVNGSLIEESLAVFSPPEQDVTHTQAASAQLLQEASLAPSQDSAVATSDLTNPSPLADSSIAMTEPVQTAVEVLTAKAEKAPENSLRAASGPLGASVEPAMQTVHLAPVKPATVKPPTPPKGPRISNVKVGRGQTLSSILIKAGVPAHEVDEAVAAVRRVYNPRKLRAGQEIALTFDTSKTRKGESAFQSMLLTPDFEREVGARRNAEGGFSSLEVKRELETKVSRADGPIKSTLSQAILAQGVPREVLGEMVSAFSYDVDFQRDIQKNDSFELMYEGLYDEKGRIVRSGNLIFASLTLSGTRMPIYRYDLENGEQEFFNDRGESIHKALLRTPVDGARLSSRYGKRKHPILGYTKMHRGADFAASKGTPIKAAGSGVVATAGRNGAYGNYVKIRHNSTFSTAYAHMSGYAKGIRSGKRVKQGQVIGYVGSTGRSTGPHLHFEVIRNGRQINPLSVKLPSGKKLKGDELEKFKRAIKKVNLKYAGLPHTTKVASRR